MLHTDDGSCLCCSICTQHMQLQHTDDRSCLCCIPPAAPTYRQQHMNDIQTAQHMQQDTFYAGTSRQRESAGWARQPESHTPTPALIYIYILYRERESHRHAHTCRRTYSRSDTHIHTDVQIHMIYNK
jgi:hypothetical protein